MPKSDSTLRRHARVQGLRLVKYRQDSRWHDQYGPYALADETNYLAVWGLDADRVADALRE